MERRFLAARMIEFNRSTQELDRKVEEFERDLKRLEENEDKYKNEVEFLRAGIRQLKNDQEIQKNKYKELKLKFTQSSVEIDFLLERIEELEKEKDSENEGSNELDTGVVQSCDNTNNEENSVGCYVLNAKESKKQEDSVNEEVKDIKKEAVDLGVNISRLLVNGMIMLSDDNSVPSKFEELRFSLDNLPNASAIKKMVSLLLIADWEVRNMKKAKILQLSAGSSEKMKDSESKERKLSAEVLDILCEKFYQEILALNSIMMIVGLDDSKNLTEDDVSALKVDLKNCEDELKAIEKQVNVLTVRYSFSINKSHDLKNLKRLMEKKINELWKGESDEEGNE